MLVAAIARDGVSPVPQVMPAGWTTHTMATR